ncbi:MAG: hypothetical protein M0Z94_03010 [Dehalococcoidales bacterium]|nr:hypothetical protein [Dehalococcoidales bacterium]
MGRAIKPSLHVGVSRGNPVVLGPRQVVPLAWSVSFSVCLPGRGGGFAWTRPLAVEVTDARGTVRKVIPDPTFWGALAVGAAGALLPLLLRSLTRQCGKQRNESVGG